MRFKKVERSLSDIVGNKYIDAVERASSFLSGRPLNKLRAIGKKKIEFWPVSIQRRLHSFLQYVGKKVSASLEFSPAGAGTKAFCKASKTALAPLSGLGYFRIAENGKLFLITKSEHYHVLLGHTFPGYRLLEYARQLGIPNATHNNTRGTIVRLLEERLIRLVNDMDEKKPLSMIGGDRINKVINLQTGSMAAEAALKLVLARFYAPETGISRPPYANRVPVILVVGNNEGGLQGNYHGTNILLQVFRGMWPGLLKRIERNALCVKVIRPNVIDDLNRAFSEFERPPYKIAAFFHEIVMMNYGAVVMTPEFLDCAYKLCKIHDVATVADEIQSCMWYPEGFLFKRYGLLPSIVIVGKGFSGGEFAASRVLVNEKYDLLPQFGALVTNGQEELASLSYLITLEWVKENVRVIQEIGQYYEKSMNSLVRKFSSILTSASGIGHLMGLHFIDLEMGKKFADVMMAKGFDISVQSYKATCPPVALTKLPLIMDEVVIDCIIKNMHDVLNRIA